MVDVVEGASPQIWVRGFSIDACNTNFLVNTLIMSFHEQATTTEWAALARELVIPEGTMRIEIILGISKDDGVTESAAARFDNVFGGGGALIRRGAWTTAAGAREGARESRIRAGSSSG